MNLANRIEHTSLKPILTERDLDVLLAEAVEHGFHGICVPPFWVKRMAREAAGTGIQLVTVAGFPLGYHQTETKILEAQTALDQGADEIDMVWNISAFKAGMTWPKIEIARMSTLVHKYEKMLKVIIETSYLDESEITEACLICQDAGVDFVKTSTGFASSGAKVEDIRLMRHVLADRVGIKASGGISDRQTAEAMVHAGADRIGTSSGVAIVS